MVHSWAAAATHTAGTQRRYRTPQASGVRRTSALHSSDALSSALGIPEVMGHHIGDLRACRSPSRRCCLASLPIAPSTWTPDNRRFPVLRGQVVFPDFRLVQASQPAKDHAKSQRGIKNLRRSGRSGGMHNSSEKQKRGDDEPFHRPRIAVATVNSYS